MNYGITGCRQCRSPDRARAEAEQAGLEVIDLQTATLRTEFHDIASVVVYLAR